MVFSALTMGGWLLAGASFSFAFGNAITVLLIACVEGAGLNPDLVNGGGGALARGHPIGASGAILAVRLFHDLHSGTGLAAIAAAGGLGTALLLEA